MQRQDFMILSIFFMCAITYCADYDSKKQLQTINHLERLARVAIKNGLDTLAASYRSKAQLLIQDVQKNGHNTIAHKASL